MFDNTRFYCDYGNLSFEFDDEHQDYELASIEYEILSSYLKNIDIALHLFCGAGRHLSVFARNGINSIGIDISSFLVKQAYNLIEQEKPQFLSSAHCVVGDALHLPFNINSFDCITALGNSLSLLSDEQINLLFYQVRQIIKYGGIFVIDIPDFEQMVNGKNPFTTSVNTCREIYSKEFGCGVLNWHRFHDFENNRICSTEEMIFYMDGRNKKKIKSHFFFHILLPHSLSIKAESFNLKVVDIMRYQDKRGKYRGMLANRIFMVFKVF